MRDARSPPGALVCPRGLGPDRGGRGCHLTQADWDKPLILVLVAALALIADRYEVKMPDGSEVVATHPAFVLGMGSSAPGQCSRSVC